MTLHNLDGSDVTHPMDLNGIKQKIDNQLYDSFKAFLLDIKIIVHNCKCLADGQ